MNPIRKYLCRAKTKDKRNMWFQGYYIPLSKTTYCFEEDKQMHPENTEHYLVYDRMTDWGLPNEHRQIEVDPNTLGMCSGIKDQNGIFIYEGDIVSIQASIKKIFDVEDDVVVFDHGCFHLQHHDVRNSLTLFCDHQGVFRGKIIGNIYDNPDLIKK